MTLGCVEAARKGIAMASYNKVILLGRLTRDPQLTYTPNHTAVVEFGLATNRQWRAQDGSQREEVCFTDCQMFGKRAEVINKYVKKGEQLFVEGRLKFDSWQAQDGTKRSKLRVMVESFEFLGGGKNQGQGQGQSQGQGYAGGNDVSNAAPVDDAGGGGGGADDIPF